jgi:phosphoribosylamine--glycine ligase
MKVGIIGSGGREHAICEAIKLSNKTSEIYCIPGNAGTNSIAKNIELNIEDFDELKNFVKRNEIDIVIVGPEKPLVDGIVDFFEKNNIKVFGPNKIASQLEGSKIFTKELCKEFNIPTANFGVFNDKKKSLEFLDNCKYPIVVKADGLAAGKGVYICETKKKSKQAVDEIFG